MDYIIATSFVIVYFLTTIYLCRNMKLKTKDLCLCGITIAITLILDSIRIPLPTGASISLASIVPFMLLAILYDYHIVFLGGSVCGLLAALFIPAWQPIHWAQLFIEHLICFSCLGYAGIFSSRKKWKIFLGMLISCIIKICAHLLSGIIFFSSNFWNGWGSFGYILIYNLSENIPLCILSISIVLSLPLSALKISQSCK